MATLSELAEVIAEVEGVDHATVAWIGRSLREAGLVAKRGRGPSAAQMGWSDATNLLIAVNATRNAAEAVKAALRYRRFLPDKDQFSDVQGRMNRDFTLGEAIEQLLMAAGSGELPNPFLGTPDEASNWHYLSDIFAAAEVNVDLRFTTNAPSALLRVAPELHFAPGFGTPENRASIPAPVLLHFSPRKVRDPPNAQGRSGDRREETTIGFRTLREVGRLIRSRAS